MFNITLTLIHTKFSHKMSMTMRMFSGLAVKDAHYHYAEPDFDAYFDQQKDFCCVALALLRF